MLVWTLCIISVVALSILPLCALIALRGLGKLLSHLQETQLHGGTPTNMVRMQHQMAFQADMRQMDMAEKKLNHELELDPEELERQEAERALS